jgi:hypothetical protein
MIYGFPFLIFDPKITKKPSANIAIVSAAPPYTLILSFHIKKQDTVQVQPHLVINLATQNNHHSTLPCEYESWIHSTSSVLIF